MHVLSSLSNCLNCNTLKLGFLKATNRSSIKMNFRGMRNGRPFVGNKKATLIPTKSIFETPREGSMLSGLAKSFCFAAGFSTTVYVGASICQYEKLKKKVSHDFSTWVSDRWNSAEGWDHKKGEIRKELNRWWNSLPDGSKVFWSIFAVNAVVVACWRVPALQLIMNRYFLMTPAARAVCWPLLFSSFSHFNIFHFAMNMYVLHSFTPLIGEMMGREQMVAFYLTGGVLSALLSQAHKVAICALNPSLGASGAIMAILAYFCITNPDRELGIVFIPGFSFSAENAIKGVMALDMAGIIFRWKLFDHAAHLGGALFGVFYAYMGQSLIWGNRHIVTQNWQKFKEKYD